MKEIAERIAKLEKDVADLLSAFADETSFSIYQVQVRHDPPLDCEYDPEKGVTKTPRAGEGFQVRIIVQRVKPQEGS